MKRQTTQRKNICKIKSIYPEYTENMSYFMTCSQTSQSKGAKDFSRRVTQLCTRRHKGLKPSGLSLHVWFQCPVSQCPVWTPVILLPIHLPADMSWKVTDPTHLGDQRESPTPGFTLTWPSPSCKSHFTSEQLVGRAVLPSTQLALSLPLVNVLPFK